MEGSSRFPTLLADAVVQQDSGVLLVQLMTGVEDQEGWRLPGGPLEYGEHPEAAIRRILKAQVGIVPDNITLAEVESVLGAPWRLIFHYRCDVTSVLAIGDGVRAARFFQLEHLPETAHRAWERELIYRVITA